MIWLIIIYIVSGVIVFRHFYKMLDPGDTLGDMLEDGVILLIFVPLVNSFITFVIIVEWLGEIKIK